MMEQIKPSDVDAVLVTWRNVDTSTIRATLKNFRSTIVMDNSAAFNLGPFAQFIGAAFQATGEYVYFQDDDCVTNPSWILKSYVPGTILCNMGDVGHAANYTKRKDKLMGFGSIFPRALVKKTFDTYIKMFSIDSILWREPGRIFTAANQELVRIVEIPVVNCAFATAPWRLYQQPEHGAMSDAALFRANLVGLRMKKEACTEQR